MKTAKFLLPLLAVILAFSTCKKDDDEPTIETQEWEFEATFNITDPDIYSFTANGTAIIESDGSTYKIVASYTVGQMTFEDIEITGDIVDGKADVTNKVVVIEFEIGGVSYTETVTFSLSIIDTSGDNASGSGPLTIVMEPGNTVEEGTLEFEATKLISK